MKTIYLVCGCSPHREPKAIRGFEHYEAAVVFAARCNEDEQKLPKHPEEVIPTAENDAEVEAWWKKLSSWRRRHPAGISNCYHNYSFIVGSLPVDDCKKC